MDLLSNFTTTALPISTTPAGPTSTDLIIGFVTAAVSVLFFGSNYVPVKKFETGDGMFFQWIVCTGIWLVGVVVGIIRGFPKFYPLVMVGGLLWATGNVCVIPIIKTIGLGLGILIWGSLNMLSGWACARFGIIIHVEPLSNYTLNTIGVILCVISPLIIVNIKPEEQANALGYQGYHDELMDEPIMPESIVNSNRVLITSPSSDETIIDRMSPIKKRVVGIFLSVISGFLYGVIFVPATYINENKKDKTNSDDFVMLDYVFAQFSGIYLTSTVYFMLYCCIKKNKPRVYPQAILPGLISGIMWGIACACWFVANELLSQPVAFPIITTVPGIVAAAWSVLLFKEIKGRKNYLILILAFVVTIAGSLCCAFST